MHQSHELFPFNQEEDVSLSSSSELDSANKIRGENKAWVLVQIVAQSHGVTVKEIFHHSRSRAPIAATRQLAMYLMHVVLGRTLTDVGEFFRRDRTTVAHACRLVEDMRDSKEFDEQVCELEAAIEFVTDGEKLTERYLAGVPVDA